MVFKEAKLLRRSMRWILIRSDNNRILIFSLGKVTMNKDKGTTGNVEEIISLLAYEKIRRQKLFLYYSPKI